MALTQQDYAMPAEVEIPVNGSRHRVVEAASLRVVLFRMYNLLYKAAGLAPGGATIQGPLTILDPSPGSFVGLSTAKGSNSANPEANEFVTIEYLLANFSPDEIRAMLEADGPAPLNLEGLTGAPAVFSITLVTANYAVKPSDCTILASGTLNVILPIAAIEAGQQFQVKNIGVGVVTVSAGGVNIDGAASFVLNVQYQAIDVKWDGSQFWIF